MTGAVEALGAGSAITDADGCILACCPRFAEMACEPISDLIGRRGRELVHPDDLPTSLDMIARFWRGGQSATVITRLRHRQCGEQLFESHIQRLHGPAPLMLSIVRPFRGSLAPSGLSAEMLGSMSAYVADMAGQLADMAAEAAMPVTCDLLRVSVAAGLQEAALGAAGRRPN